MPADDDNTRDRLAEYARLRQRIAADLDRLERLRERFDDWLAAGDELRQAIVCQHLALRRSVSNWDRVCDQLGAELGDDPGDWWKQGGALPSGGN